MIWVDIPPEVLIISKLIVIKIFKIVVKVRKKFSKIHKLL